MLRLLALIESLLECSVAWATTNNIYIYSVRLLRDYFNIERHAGRGKCGAREYIKGRVQL